MRRQTLFQQFFTSQRKFFKIFLLTTFFLNFLAITTQDLCREILHTSTLYDFFGLNQATIEHAWYWQVFTNALLLPMQEFSFSWIFSISLSMYLLSSIGSALISQKGGKHFFTLYFSTSLFISLCMLFTFTFSPYFFSSYFGMKAIIGSLLFAWCILNPETRIQLFLIIPIKLTSLLFWGFFFQLFLTLSQGNFSELTAYACALLYTYLYALFIWRQKSPIPFLQNFETTLLTLLTKQFSIFTRKTSLGSSKIYDFKTGKALVSDEAFLKAATAKITLKGKKSLTLKERFRLWKISKKLQKKSLFNHFFKP